VVCVVELGPLAVTTYPGEEWKVGPERATLNLTTVDGARFGSTGPLS
jgi:hypothetical protein